MYEEESIGLRLTDRVQVGLPVSLKDCPKWDSKSDTDSKINSPLLNLVPANIQGRNQVTSNETNWANPQHGGTIERSSGTVQME